MAGVTPMMEQYLEIKGRHQDALLFYRMGDFYELFFEDAAEAAAALDIALTKRGKHEGADIPMCGVPVHAAEGYLLTLIRKGFRVAVCEQLENPAEAKKRGSKAVVKRDVVRLVTPGTLTEESLLEARRHNFLAAYTEVRDDAALAWVDISTGAFSVMPLTPVRLGPELARLIPAEVLLPEGLNRSLETLIEEGGASVMRLGPASFDSASAERRLSETFGTQGTAGFGQFTRPEIGAMGALIDYLELTQKGQMPLLRAPRREESRRTLQIDAATRRNLEITQTMSGKKAGSLLATIDRTLTAAGGRLLERRLSAPSRVPEVINTRLDAVAWLHGDSSLRTELRAALRTVPDLDRALGRLAMDRGGPRDMVALRSGLQQAAKVREQLDQTEVPDLIGRITPYLTGHDALLETLERAMADEPPLLIRDGGAIAECYNSELDELRKIRDNGRGVIAQLEAQYRAETGISSLKIKHNNVLGYFVETTATHAEKMLSAPLNETFKHRQTTANQVRFTTLELSELETRILNSTGEALALEKHIYEELRSQILSASGALGQTARALAELDLQCALAELAANEDLIRPRVDNSRAFHITGGRHMVVEAALKREGTPFIANDCALNDGTIWLLTGPNMAGKSTFLRQNALIAIMAQMGAFVPARDAHIGIVSQLFSRVGASDDLARGRSTFMVEMVETAAILNQADDRALVILDEIGRGTATYDGLSIAWAALEHLHEVNRTRALFATHYHELTQLAASLDTVENATVTVKEHDGHIIFLHEVRKGAADRSYGVQVAQLAGLPPKVIARARSVLEALEQGEREGNAGKKALIDDLPLFSAVPNAPTVPAQEEEGELRKSLDALHPDHMTPLEALEALYALKRLAQDAG